MTPLQPLAPAQRIAWLVHHSVLKCRRSHGALSPCFLKGKTYAITTELARVQFKEGDPPRTFTGHDLLIRIRDEKNEWHRCLPHPSPTPDGRMPHPLIHDFVFLVKHFAIPDVPDVADRHPQQLAEMKKRLRAL